MSRHSYTCMAQAKDRLTVVVEKDGKVWIAIDVENKYVGEIMLSVKDSKALLNQLLEIEKIGE